MGRKWHDFYRNVCGEPDLLLANQCTHKDFITEVARYARISDPILEIGAGTGVLLGPLALAGAKVVSLDNDPVILDMARVNAQVLGLDIEYVEGDAFKLAYEDNHFAVAESSGLLEHFCDEDIRAIVVESCRVARVAVHGVPLIGRRIGAFGDERWMDENEWAAICGGPLLRRWMLYEEGWSWIGVFSRYEVE